jgi:hypothetical protein
MSRAPLFSSSKSGRSPLASAICAESWIFDMLPANDLADCCAIWPANFGSAARPARMALTPPLPLISPAVTILLISAVVLPYASARYWSAGTPASVSWRSSSPDALPFSCIWPRASTTRSMPSLPLPRADSASPMARSAGTTDWAEKPIACIRFDASTRSGNWKGVEAANWASSLMCASAACALPRKVVKVMVADWSAEFRSIEFLTATPRPAPRARTPAPAATPAMPPPISPETRPRMPDAPPRAKLPAPPPPPPPDCCRPSAWMRFVSASRCVMARISASCCRACTVSVSTTTRLRSWPSPANSDR